MRQRVKDKRSAQQGAIGDDQKYVYLVLELNGNLSLGCVHLDIHVTVQLEGRQTILPCVTFRNAPGLWYRVF